MPDPAPLDPQTIVSALAGRGVRFLTVGGQAALWHGATRVTKDIDICPAWDADNLERLGAALTDLNARLLVPDGPEEGIEIGIDGSFLAKMELSTWRTMAGDVDVVLGIPRDRRWNLARFEELRERGTIVQLAETSVTLAALDDIVRSKEISGRPSDDEALPELR